MKKPAPAPATLGLSGPWWTHGDRRDLTVAHPPEEAFFRLAIPGGGATRLRIAASNAYQCWCDGTWLGFGPARAAHGRLTVDELELPVPADGGACQVVVQVLWEGLFTFDHVMGSPGLWFAVERDGVTLPVEVQVTAHSGRLACHRFSHQRGWVEEVDRRQRAAGLPGAALDPRQWRAPVLRTCDPAVVLDRRDIPCPTFAIRKARSVMFAGSADPARRTAHRVFGYEGSPGFPATTDCPASRIQEEALRPCLASDANLAGLTEGGRGAVVLGRDRRGLDRTLQLDFAGEVSGLIDLAVDVPAGTVIDLGWSEGLWQDDLMGCWARSAQPDGSVPSREFADSRQGMRIICRGGGVEEHFGLFIAAFRYLRIAFRLPARSRGGIAVHRLQLRSVGYPVVRNGAFACADRDLDRVFEAAVATMENSISDTFMDCPGRERGAWLNDSFWAAAGLHAVSGDVAMERRFLGLFTHHRPDGMIQPLYPSECLAWQGGQQKAIGTHALFWLLQVERHLRLHGDAALRKAWRPAVAGLLACLERFRSREGLLERTPWDTFYDWSETQRGEIQTVDNLIYALALIRLGRLFGERGWNRQGGETATALDAAAWNAGRELYADVVVRDERGRLRPGRGVSATINAVALWSELVPPAKAARIWRQSRNFHPQTMDRTLFSYETNFVRSNAYGVLYRLEHAGRIGAMADMVRDLKEAYLPMLDRGQSCIGEHLGHHSSLCHGYNAYVAVLLQRYVAGIELPGRPGEVIRIRPRPTTLDWCQARSPWMDGQVQVWWSRTADGCRAMVSLPKGQRGELIDPYSGRAIRFKETLEWTGSPGGQRG